MKLVVLGLVALLLSACASDQRAANVSQPIEQAVAPNRSVERYSDRYFLNFAEALNRDSSKALRQHMDQDKSVDYIEQRHQINLNSQQRQSLGETYSSLSNATLAALLKGSQTQWKFIASEKAEESLVLSYYRLVAEEGFAFYRLTWFEGAIVDMYNLNTGVGTEDTFNLIVKMNSYERQNPQLKLERLADFFNYLGQANHQQMMFAYNDLPKSFKFQEMVLGGIMQASTSNPQMVLPAAFVIYMDKQQPIHPRYFAYYYDHKQYQLAEACLHAFPEPVVADVRMQMELAQLYSARGEQAQAKALLIDGILNFPNESFAYLALLDNSLNSGEYQQAELLLKVLFDRFELAFTRADFTAFESGRGFVNSPQYQHYRQYIN